MPYNLFKSSLRQDASEALSEEKADATHIRTTDAQDANSELELNDGRMSPKEWQYTIRKVDWRLVPFLSACYSVSLIDRTNISFARAAGMNMDLNLGVGNRYSIAVLVFFIPYILLELPSNIGLRRFGAAVWLSTAVTIWGCLMIAMAFVKTYQQLAALRALIGMFEAALFPGATYLISCWYARKQVQTRLSLFYMLSILAAGLSAILAYGLGKIYTINQSLRPWQWIFVVQGLLTVVLGLLGYRIIVDFPDKAKFLTEEQQRAILLHIENDRADSVADTFTFQKFLAYLLDVKLWTFALMSTCTTCAAYSLAYFLPNILHGMGFDLGKSQILVAPPYVWAVIPAILSAKASDKSRIRSIWIIANAVCAIIGLTLFSFLPIRNTAGRYAGIFLCAGGANSNVPLIIGWSQISIRSQSKRAYTSALTLAFGGVGGIVSALVFVQRQAPQYRIGIYFTIAAQIFVVVCSVLLSFSFRRSNRTADLSQGKYVIEGHPMFRYQL